jgi:predicted sugar kinase
MLGLAAARALAVLQGAPADAVALAHALGWGPDRAPEVWAFDQGGLLLTDVRALLGTPPLGRLSIGHPDEQAWVLVLYLPKPPDEAPDSLEAARRAALLAAAERVPAWTGRLVTETLWPAAEHDDFPAFARAAQRLLDANLGALRAAGARPALLPEAQMVLEMLQAGGAALCGPCLTGLGVFGLVPGARRSVELRRPIMARLGHAAGTLLTTITHNAGARHGPALDFGP